MSSPCGFFNPDCMSSGDTLNAFYRSIFGVDSPSRQKEMQDALIKAGMPIDAARKEVDRIQEQNKSTTLGNDLFSAGKIGLRDFVIGAGIVFAIYIVFQIQIARLEK